MKKLFVTVGTTKFDQLIETLLKDEVLNVIYQIGFSSMQIQVGNGRFEEKKHPNIDIKYDNYIENFGEEISNCDLVISHAGAGTCLEVLKKQKPLIVVVNEKLMNNHQIELAQQLQEDGYLQFCTPTTLAEILLKNKFYEHKIYKTVEPKLFSNYLNHSMGFL